MSNIEGITGKNPFGNNDTIAKVSVTKNSYLPIATFPSGGQFILSAYIKSASASEIRFLMGEASEMARIDVSNTWQRLEMKIDARTNDEIILRLPVNTYYLYNWKIEEGNKATTYTVAPEDTDEEISELNTKYSTVTQTVEGISATVGEQKTQINGLETKVEKNETNYVQLSDMFKWIVSSGTSSSDFTLTDRMAELTAEIISLNGDVKVDGKMLVDGAVTAEKIDVEDLAALKATIGGWNMTTQYIFKQNNAYISPNRTHAKKVKEYVLGTGTLTTAEKQYFDINGDGVSDLKDAFTIQQVARGKIEYESQAGAVTSPLIIKIDSTSGTKTIVFTATNPLGEIIESFIGVNSCKFPFVIGDSVYGANVEGAVVETTNGANLDEVKQSVSDMGSWQYLTLINGWTGSLYARYDKTNKYVHINGYVTASSSVTNLSFCDLIGNGLPTPVNGTLSAGVTCVTSSKTIKICYAYNNQYLTMHADTNTPISVSLDFTYRY